MAAADEEQYFPICCVCQDYFSDPKILPCTHLLCRGCLVELMRDDEAQCPLCRGIIVDKRSHDVKNQIQFAESLPTDPVTTAGVECAKILNEDLVCHVHTNTDAASLCLHCMVKLCRVCAEVHKKLPVTSSHHLEDLAALTVQRLLADRQPLCPDHPDAKAEYFCAAHNVCLCQLCATSRHRECPEMKRLNEVVEALKQSLLEVQTKLSAAESSLHQAMTNIDKNILKSKENAMVTRATIDATCDRLLALVESCRKRLKKRVENADDKMKTASIKQKAVISPKRGRVTSHLSLIKRVLLMPNFGSLATMLPALISRMNDLDTSVPLPAQPSPTATMTFDRKVLDGVEEQLTALADLVISATSTSEEIVWRFHIHHGKSVILKSGQRTAEFNIFHAGNIVMSSESLMETMLYEVRVEESWNETYAYVGIVTENPTDLILPDYPEDIKSAIVIYTDVIYVKGQRMECDIGNALKSIKVGSRVGVLIDDDQCLHMYIDGKDQGVAYRDVQQPCYAVFSFFYKKITTLPLTRF